MMMMMVGVVVAVPGGSVSETWSSQCFAHHCIPSFCARFLYTPIPKDVGSDSPPG
jgi:hypothetical protein